MAAPPVVWRPDAELLRESNVARFMAAEGIADFDALVGRSIAEPEWFWDAIVRFLALPLRRAATTACSTPPTASRGRSGSVGGALQRRDERASTRGRDATHPRSIWEGEDGATRTLDVRASCAP